MEVLSYFCTMSAWYAYVDVVKTAFYHLLALYWRGGQKHIALLRTIGPSGPHGGDGLGKLL